MGIHYYVGTDGVTINVEHPRDLYEALDILHTQVIDNTPKSNQEDLLPILEEAMEKVIACGYEVE